MTPRPRYRAVTPVTDFSVSQQIRVALIEDGRTDLAVESITQPIRELEENLARLRNRVIALEREKVEWQTASGVHRIIKQHIGAVTVDWVKWAVRAALCGLGAAFIAVIGWAVRLAWHGPPA